MSTVTNSSPTQSGVGYDVVAILGFDKGFGNYSSTEFFIQFSNNSSIFKGIFKKEKNVEDADNEDAVGRGSNLSKTTIAKPLIVMVNNEQCDSVTAVMVNDRLTFIDEGGVYTTTPSSRTLEQFGLRGGRNTVSFESREYQCEVTCHVWLWSVCDRMVVVDVDGTLTRSDVRGYVETVYLGMYDYIHSGVVDFLNNMVAMGAVMTSNEVVSSSDHPSETRLGLGREVTSNLRVVYLTARPLRHLAETKRFIGSLRPFREQGGEGSNSSRPPHLSLPAGPLFCNKVGQFQALYGEMIGTTADFKGQLLQDIETQFVRVGRRGESPWVLGIGNKDTDAKAYEMCNIRRENIFIVQKSSAIHCQVRQPCRQEHEELDVGLVEPHSSSHSHDQEVLDLLEQNSIAPSDPSTTTPPDPSPQPVGKAIVENTLALFSDPSGGTNSCADRRHGVDRKGHGLLDKKNPGMMPSFLPGDNGGLLIEGETNWQMEVDAPATSYVTTRDGMVTYPVHLHVFSGYADPVLLEYTRHVLWEHHLASSSQSLQKDERFRPFDFPLPSREVPSQTLLAPTRAVRISDDGSGSSDRNDIRTSRRSIRRGGRADGGQSFSSPSRSSAISAGNSTRQLIKKLSSSRLQPRAESPQPDFSDGTISSGGDPGLNMPRPPSLRRNTSAPLPSPSSSQSNSRLPLPPQLPVSMRPGCSDSTGKGVKMIHMTDYFNSEHYADV